MHCNRKIHVTLQIACFMCLVFSGCKPETFVFEDNAIPHYDEISTILVQNYVNRYYIDLIGREPNDLEMARDVQILEEGDLTASIRLQVLDVLMAPEWSVTAQGISTGWSAGFRSQIGL
jgi:hypothetical protein